MHKCIITQTWETSDKVNNGRTAENILCSLVEEVGELAKEVRIRSGNTYKKPGKDGILGEAVDVIQNALDLVRKMHPEATVEDLLEINRNKCAKWVKCEEGNKAS